MTNPEISIIIPVYNTEKYVKKCLNSIREQSYLNWECILIDDGSTDESGKICDKYAISDSRFRVIHKKNEGVSVARNTGIQLACGKWIGFVDSDDWIEKDTYKTAYQYAMDTNADIVQWGYCRSDGKHDYDHHVYKNEYNISNFENSITEKEPYFGFVFTLINRNLLMENNILFQTDLIMGEDYIFSLQCYLVAKKVVNIKDKCFYHYFQNPNSACHNMSKKHRLGQIVFLKKFEEMVMDTEYKNSLMTIVNRLKAGFKSRMLKEKNFVEYRANFPEIENMLYEQKKVFRPAMFCLDRNLDFFASVYLSVLSILVSVKQKLRKRGS